MIPVGCGIYSVVGNNQGWGERGWKMRVPVRDQAGINGMRAVAERLLQSEDHYLEALL